MTFSWLLQTLRCSWEVNGYSGEALLALHANSSWANSIDEHATWQSVWLDHSFVHMRQPIWNCELVSLWMWFHFLLTLADVVSTLKCPWNQNWDFRTCCACPIIIWTPITILYLKITHKNSVPKFFYIVVWWRTSRLYWWSCNYMHSRTRIHATLGGGSYSIL